MMKKQIECVEIPACYYENGRPMIANYGKELNKGIAYRLSAEEEYEQRAAFGSCSGYNVISALSPYVRGWEDKRSAADLELIAIDIEDHKVYFREK